jgi:uncharacterized protein (TIGR02284 family)
MTRDEIIGTLTELAQLDIDAVLAYDAALDEIRDASLADVLEAFQDDHEQHVHDLSAAIIHFGGTPPSYNRDAKGFLMAGMTSIASKIGARGALLALRANETLVSGRYETALGRDLPLEAKDIVERCYEDERRHLAFVQRALDDELWLYPDRIGAMPHRDDSMEHPV